MTKTTGSTKKAIKKTNINNKGDTIIDKSTGSTKKAIKKTNINNKGDTIIDKSNIINKDKKILVIDKGFIYENYDEEKLSQIKDFDINKEYIIESDNHIIINRDYKDLAPYVRYLLSNIEESKEMKAIKMLFVFMIIGLFFHLISLFFIIQKNSNIISRIDIIEENKNTTGNNDKNILDNISGIKKNNLIPKKPESGGNGDFYID